MIEKHKCVEGRCFNALKEDDKYSIKEIQNKIMKLFPEFIEQDVKIYDYYGLCEQATARGLEYIKVDGMMIWKKNEASIPISELQKIKDELKHAILRESETHSKMCSKTCGVYDADIQANIDQVFSKHPGEKNE